MTFLSCVTEFDVWMKKMSFFSRRCVFLVRIIRFCFLASSSIAIPWFEYNVSMPQILRFLHNLPNIPSQINFVAINYGSFVKRLNKSKSRLGFCSSILILLFSIANVLIIFSIEILFAFLFTTSSKLDSIAISSFL